MAYDKAADEAKKAATEAIRKAQELRTIAAEVEMLHQRIQAYFDKWRMTPLENITDLKRLRKAIEQLMELKIRRAERIEHLTKH
jgi:hypothetical protein